MTNRRDTPVVRGEPVEKLLDALARPPEPHDEGADALPPNTMAVLAQARELREDLARVIQAVEYLPVERCDFFIDSLRPWQSKVKETKRQRKRAWQEVEDAARSTDPDTPQRQQAMNEPFASVLRDSGVLTFLKVTYRPHQTRSRSDVLDQGRDPRSSCGWRIHP